MVSTALEIFSDSCTIFMSDNALGDGKWTELPSSIITGQDEGRIFLGVL